MKNLLSIALLATLVIGCKEKTKETAEEAVSDEMAKTEMEVPTNEWKVLFDGKTFDGWHEYNKEGVSDHWKIEDGAMVYYPPKERVNNEHYNLVSTGEYTDFILSMEWRISEAGNSGIFWGVKEMSDQAPYRTGPEIQVLDNDKHPDGKNGTSHQAGALYDMVSPSEDVTKPIGDWNLCVVTINHKTNMGKVVLNDVEVVSFPLNDPEWSEMVSKSKFADWDHFGKYTTGKIGVQDHGDIVAFRNIKIKEL